jgi:ankyrin repeat protein
MSLSTMNLTETKYFVDEELLEIPRDDDWPKFSVPKLIKIYILMYGRECKFTTLLHFAAQHSLRDLVVYLLKIKNENPNGRDDRGHTALHYASSTGNKHIVQLLLEHGAENNVKDRNGLTPFKVAEYFGHVELAKFIEEYKVNPVVLV